MSTPARTRCGWCGDDPLYVDYHDREWGLPCRDETRLFEMLILEGAQAGLAWITVLRKREGYRSAFANFDPEAVARFDARRRSRLLQDPGIVRNRLKVESAVRNAQVWLRLREEQHSVVDHLWSFVGGRPLQNAWESLDDCPARTPESDAMSRSLKAAGMNFVGSTICYAFMQATGMVNDHLVGCFRHAACRRAGRARGA